jgi:hemerythrin-like domain-containing protein
MVASTSIALPGLHSPAAGFEAPFELLAACHERVQRSLQLLQRLVEHLARHGADAQARSAAQDVWRYFAIAAPEHHADEERHVLPLLRASGDAALVAAAERLHADHEAMDAIWQRLGPQLQALADAALPWPADALAPLRDAAGAFVAVHEQHVPLEDELAFPAARARLQAPALAAMGAEMAARRRA